MSSRLRTGSPRQNYGSDSPRVTRSATTASSTLARLEYPGSGDVRFMPRVACCSGADLLPIMSRFTFGKRHDAPGDRGVAVDPVARQYRYLLRTAPADALEAGHAEAITLLSEGQKETLLETLRSRLLVGDHLTASENTKMAHLVTVGERTSPGQLLGTLPPEVLQDLAAKVLESESSFGLLGGYAGSDGAEPRPPDDSAWADGGFNPKVSQRNPHDDPRTGQAGAHGGYSGGGA